MPVISDQAQFIQQNTRLLPVPHTPEIRLYVADEATTLWQKTEDELGEIGLPPPFWAFAWAGGQALARYILDNPGIVRGKRVLDFASGSGLVAIAAAMAGASHVEAADIDAFAIAAIVLNAEVNGVADRISTTITDTIGNHGPWDVILAGDICYQKDIAAKVTDWLQDLHVAGKTVLIGDPGRSYLPRTSLVSVASYQVPTTRALEDNDIKNSSVWRFA
ncbi:MAG: class I SAM-dependent methyltransferase [Beijerinckiaceae bacterium]